jgi:hypothetical protein
VLPRPSSRQRGNWKGCQQQRGDELTIGHDRADTWTKTRLDKYKIQTKFR